MAANTRLASQCTSCGACCFTSDPQYIELWSVDRERLGSALDQAAHRINDRWYLKMADGHCRSLRVETDAQNQQRFLCSIYDRRPDACRAFAEDSRACQLVRADTLARRAR
ncbi:MAG: YkgJ family cysteine cluster protein [Polyangiales bacterium]